MAHSITGSGATFGVPGASKAAGELEAFLERYGRKRLLARCEGAANGVNAARRAEAGRCPDLEAGPCPHSCVFLSAPRSRSRFPSAWAFCSCSGCCGAYSAGEFFKTGQEVRRLLQVRDNLEVMRRDIERAESVQLRYQLSGDAADRGEFAQTEPARLRRRSRCCAACSSRRIRKNGIDRLKRTVQSRFDVLDAGDAETRLRRRGRRALVRRAQRRDGEGGARPCRRDRRTPAAVGARQRGAGRESGQAAAEACVLGRRDRSGTADLDHLRHQSLRARSPARRGRYCLGPGAACFCARRIQQRRMGLGSAAQRSLSQRRLAADIGRGSARRRR